MFQQALARFVGCNPGAKSRIWELPQSPMRQPTAAELMGKDREERVKNLKRQVGDLPH